MRKKNKTGRVYIVGGGVPDADFVTLKGKKILSQANVVIYDYLVDKNILRYTSPDAELIPADEVAARRKRERFSDGFAIRQEVINDIMVKKALSGKSVVRLKNGDPMIFGRVNEEMTALVKNRIPFKVMPGVSAFLAAASLCGIPLTARGVSSSVTIVTGHEASSKKDNGVEWDRLAHLKTTIVVYMGVENLSVIARRLIECGKDPSTPVAAISMAAGYPPVLVESSLKDIDGDIVKSRRIIPPAIFIIGEVVKLRKKNLARIPRILFTGLSDERFFEKGDIYHHPLIEIKPIEDYTTLDSAIEKIYYASSVGDNTYGKKPYHWIVFTSRFGVYHFFRRLFLLGFDARILCGIKIAAIGKSTSDMLLNYGIKSDLIPRRQESSHGLLKEFSSLDLKGKHILLPRSDIADKGVAEELEKLGAVVDSIVAYKNVPAPYDPVLKKSLEMFDEIIFTSPSCVRNFISAYGMPLRKVKVRTIGPVTAKEWRKYLL